MLEKVLYLPFPCTNAWKNKNVYTHTHTHTHIYIYIYVIQLVQILMFLTNTAILKSQICETYFIDVLRQRRGLNIDCCPCLLICIIFWNWQVHLSMMWSSNCLLKASHLSNGLMYFVICLINMKSSLATFRQFYAMELV